MINIILKLISGLVLASAVIANEQTPPTVVLDRAIAFHGGQALEQLRSYSDEYGLIGSVLGIKMTDFRVRYLVDFENQRARIEYINDGTPILIAQETSSEAWTWSKTEGINEGKKAIPGRLSLFPPLRLGTISLLLYRRLADRLEYEPTDILYGLKGASLSLVTNANRQTILFAENGAILADRSITVGNDRTGKEVRTDSGAVYGSFVKQEGVLIAQYGTAHNPELPGWMDGRIALYKADVNPKFSATTFARPQ